VLALVLLQAACTDSQLTKAAKASDDIAVSISLAIDVKRSLAMSVPPLITPEEELTLTLALQRVNTATMLFREKAMTFKTLDANTKTALLPLFQTITASVTELNNQGILGIKNQDAKAKVALVLTSLSAALATIQSVLMGGA